MYAEAWNLVSGQYKRSNNDDLKRSEVYVYCILTAENCRVGKLCKFKLDIAKKKLLHDQLLIASTFFLLKIVTQSHGK